MAPLVGNGDLQTRRLELPAFTSLDVHSGLKLVYHSDASLKHPDVRFTSDANLLPALAADVADGRLDVHFRQPVQAHQQTLEISAPPPALLILQGGTEASVDQLIGRSNYRLELRGGSRLEVSRLEGERLQIALHGGSWLKVAGRVERLETETLAGASQADLQDLQTRDALMHLQGASEARITASRRIETDMAGASKLYYAGPAELQTHRMDGGSQAMALLMR